MGVWRTLLGTSVGLLLGGPLGALAGGQPAADLAPVRTGDVARLRAGTPERRQVAFTIAAIALAAKMARADGNASAAEFATFERLFKVPEHERANAARFYRLAQGSTAGFEAYASQAAALLGPGTPVLEDLLEALLLIAVTDGVHPAELDYLQVVAERLGFDAAAYARIRARYIAPSADDPYVVLGVDPGAPRRGGARRLPHAGQDLSSRPPHGRRHAARVPARRRGADGGDQRRLCRGHARAPHDRAAEPQLQRPAAAGVDDRPPLYRHADGGRPRSTGLTDPAAEVSAHYVVAEDGVVVRMVDEAKRAWHAGKSWWRGITDVNSASVGIEIVNPGHEFGYRPFPEPQMAAVEGLVRGIVGRYAIAPGNVVGHSDIAPARKDDPGELFDWPRLARAGLADPVPAAGADPGWTDAGFLAALHRYGYDVDRRRRRDDRLPAPFPAARHRRHGSTPRRRGVLLRLLRPELWLVRRVGIGVVLAVAGEAGRQHLARLLAPWLAPWRARLARRRSPRRASFRWRIE